MDCVVCNCRKISDNHKCDPKKLNSIDAAMKREPNRYPAQTFQQRLYVGFKMLEGKPYG